MLERFVGDASEQVTVYGITDYKSPYASGSARVDAYVVCPCSMSTVGTLAAGAMANLVHRAAFVALKERRKLVLVPRETPLSSIHLRGLATLHEAGAVILLAAPGFYHGATTIEDLVDFVVARALDQIGVDNTLMPRWGSRARVVGLTEAPWERRCRLRRRRSGDGERHAPADGVRTMFDRIAGPSTTS